MTGKLFKAFWTLFAGLVLISAVCYSIYQLWIAEPAEEWFFISIIKVAATVVSIVGRSIVRAIVELKNSANGG